MFVPITCNHGRNYFIVGPLAEDKRQIHKNGLFSLSQGMKDYPKDSWFQEMPFFDHKCQILTTFGLVLPHLIANVVRTPQVWSRNGSGAVKAWTPPWIQVQTPRSWPSALKRPSSMTRASCSHAKCRSSVDAKSTTTIIWHVSTRYAPLTRGCPAATISRQHLP